MDLSLKDEILRREIKRNLLFFITDEKIMVSVLYELIKISPGRWFDIEEFTLRGSMKDLCHNKDLVIEILKSLNEFEYNSLTGQIRIKNLLTIDDVVNEKTVIFFGQNIELSEEDLNSIIESNKLTRSLVRIIKFLQLDRRDLKPLRLVLKNQPNIYKDTDIIVLKMSSRSEALKIQNIIEQRYTNISSCLAIRNYFPHGSLSINMVNNGESVNNGAESGKINFLSIHESLEGFSLIIYNYIYRFNEYAVILDQLIQENLKPLAFRSFTEFRLKSNEMKCIKYFKIPDSYIGCFSILTLRNKDEVSKAELLIKNLSKHLYVEQVGKRKPPYPQSIPYKPNEYTTNTNQYIYPQSHVVDHPKLLNVGGFGVYFVTEKDKYYL